VAAFELIRQDEITYPQPWYVPGQGFFLLFTKYTNGRELYWQTSSNGLHWSPHQKLAGIGGHYQVSGVYRAKFAPFSIAIRVAMWTNAPICISCRPPTLGRAGRQWTAGQ
jgi:hypothetical protein